MDTYTGKIGEKAVSRWLVKHGYQIIEQNYHSRFGEIDIIARNKKYLVFTEVKTRQENSLASPFEAITVSKQRKIALTARAYLSRYPSELQPRFDCAAVTTKNGKVLAVDYMENAFLDVLHF